MADIPDLVAFQTGSLPSIFERSFYQTGYKDEFADPTECYNVDHIGTWKASPPFRICTGVPRVSRKI
ncbi:hypothetical protein CVT25_002627 [Psilocybe cyanescens]|uniref:Uncharacterized protein n=1 Tax=Psilocybe cyanescens TaxID=93625 RepID=A0A409WLR6_PSICY|nr:hypothetical protein CVT25_002627 [Psilocybe cyanescens]